MLNRPNLGFAALALLAGLTTAGGAFAQIASGASASGAVATSEPGAAAAFDGLDVQILRLIRDPNVENGFRLVMRVTNTAKEERRLLFVRPAASLTDDMGNVYLAADSSGVLICASRANWDIDLNACRQNRGEAATRLAQGVPVTVSARFAPGEGFAKDLAEISSNVSLRARVGSIANDFKTATSIDIVVNDIPLPQ